MKYLFLVMYFVLFSCKTGPNNGEGEKREKDVLILGFQCEESEKAGHLRERLEALGLNFSQEMKVHAFSHMQREEEKKEIPGGSLHCENVNFDDRANDHKIKKYKAIIFDWATIGHLRNDRYAFVKKLAGDHLDKGGLLFLFDLKTREEVEGFAYDLEAFDLGDRETREVNVRFPNDTAQDFQVPVPVGDEESSVYYHLVRQSLGLTRSIRPKISLNALSLTEDNAKARMQDFFDRGRGFRSSIRVVATFGVSTYFEEMDQELQRGFRKVSGTRNQYPIDVSNEAARNDDYFAYRKP